VAVGDIVPVPRRAVRGNPGIGEPGHAAGDDCAARRPAVFPVQPGGIRRIFLGLMAYLEPKGKGGNIMPQESSGRAQA